MISRIGKIVITLTLLAATGGAFAQVGVGAIPVAKDASGKVLGPIVDFTEFTTTEALTTVLFVAGEPVFIGVNSAGGLFDVGFGFIPAYTGPQCTGTLYLTESGSNANFATAISVNAPIEDSSGTLTVYTTVNNAVVESGLSLQSYIRTDGACVDGGAPSTATEGILAEAHQTSFAGPYTVEQGPSVAQAGFAFAIPHLSTPARVILLTLLAFVGIGYLVRRRGSLPG